MNIGKNGGETAEPDLVKLYMDMTGSTESQARSVFMLVTVENGQNGEDEFRGAGPGLSVEQPWNWARNDIVPATQSRLAAPMNVLPLSIPQGA